MLKNTKDDFGLVAKLFHLISAIVVIGLFILGFWMVDLTYYHQWYQTAPFIHRSVGILFAAFLFLRIFWSFINVSPAHLHPENHMENFIARSAHILLYCFMVIIVISGYFISTADGSGINVFDWFTLPAANSLLQLINDDNLADKAGFVHKYVAYALMILVVMHIMAVIYHHVYHKDRTFARMFNFKSK